MTIFEVRGWRRQRGGRGRKRRRPLFFHHHLNLSLLYHQDARKEGDEEGEAWLAAGLPGLQAADLDFNRYGDTLFEVLFAGGRMGAGGAVASGAGAAAAAAGAAAAATAAGLPPLAPATAAKAGTKALPRFLLGPMTPPTHDGVAPYMAAFQALLRRRPFLVKGLEATLAKLTAGVDFYDGDARQRTAVAAARCFAARLGAQSDAVMLPLLNDRAVAKARVMKRSFFFFFFFFFRSLARSLNGDSHFTPPFSLHFRAPPSPGRPPSSRISYPRSPRTSWSPSCAKPS